MKECSKSIHRRLQNPNFIRHYFRGAGIDIGGAPDPLSLYKELFPLIDSVRCWDLADGDAQFMTGVADESYDFVHSSHCLEHMHDPREALGNWMRVLKPGGHLVITVPDEDMYEQGVFPSSFNRDHKWTFTVYKETSWSTNSINLLHLLAQLGVHADLRRFEVIDFGYRHELPRYDQTLTPVAESAIEFVIRKRTSEEIAVGGRLPRENQPDEDVRRHLNQYRDDQAALRQGDQTCPPFNNTKFI
jgi:SAM-dependent methyltransferase